MMKRALQIHLDLAPKGAFDLMAEKALTGFQELAKAESPRVRE